MLKKITQILRSGEKDEFQKEGQYKSIQHNMNSERFPNCTFQQIDINIETTQPLYDFILIHRSHNLHQTAFNQNSYLISPIQKNDTIRNVPILNSSSQIQQVAYNKKEQFEISFSLRKNTKFESMLSNFKLTTFNFPYAEDLYGEKNGLTLIFKDVMYPGQTIQRVKGSIRYRNRDAEIVSEDIILVDKVKGVEQLRNLVKQEFKQTFRNSSEMIQSMNMGYQRNLLQYRLKSVMKQFNNKDILATFPYFNIFRNYFIRILLQTEKQRLENQHKSKNKTQPHLAQSIQQSLAGNTEPLAGQIIEPENQNNQNQVIIQFTNDMSYLHPELAIKNAEYRLTIDKVIQNNLMVLKRYYKPNSADLQSQQRSSGLLQSCIGNCHQISSLDQIVTQAPQFLQRVCVVNSNQPLTASQCNLNIDGQIKQVSTDKKIPTLQIDRRKGKSQIQLAFQYYQNHTILQQASKKNLQKALIIISSLSQIYSGHDNLANGQGPQTFMNLTNSTSQFYSSEILKTKSHKLDELKDLFRLWQNNRNHNKKDKVLITIGFQISELKKFEKAQKFIFELLKAEIVKLLKGEKIDDRHQFSFYGYFEMKNDVKLLRLRNPHQNSGMRWMNIWKSMFGYIYDQWYSIQKKQLGSCQFLIHLQWLIQIETYFFICETNSDLIMTNQTIPLFFDKITKLKLNVYEESQYCITLHKINRRNFYQIVKKYQLQKNDQKKIINLINKQYDYPLVSLKLTIQNNMVDQTLQVLVGNQMYTHMKCILKPNLTYILEISQRLINQDQNLQELEEYFFIKENNSNRKSRNGYCTIVGPHHGTIKITDLNPSQPQEIYHFQNKSMIIQENKEIRYTFNFDKITDSFKLKINNSYQKGLLNTDFIKPQQLWVIVVVEVRNTRAGFTGITNKYKISYSFISNNQQCYYKLHYTFNPEFTYKLSISTNENWVKLWQHCSLIQFERHTGVQHE